VSGRNPVHRLLAGNDRSIGGTVYGTVLALAALTAGAAEKQSPRELLLLVAATAAVIWVAHVYAHGLGESIERGHRLDWKEFSGIARHELPILIAAGGPTVVLVFGAVGLVDEQTDIWLAFAVGLASLAAQGGRYARVERLGLIGTLLAVAANLALGVLVVLLKVLVGH